MPDATAELFPDAPRREIVRVATAPRPGLRTRLTAEQDWTVEDHVCRACLGRVLGRAGAGGREYMCADCGHRETGATRTGNVIHPTMCACGTRYGTRDAGIRCVVNETPTPELPQAIVASQVG